MAYYHLNQNTTGVEIQKGTVGLKRITVGNAGSTDWSVTIYDGVDTNGKVVSVNHLNAGGQYDYEIPLATGLFVVASGTTAGDITIVYD